MKTLSKEPFKDFKYPTLLSQLIEIFSQDLEKQILELEEKELLNFLQSCTAKVGKELFGKMINYHLTSKIEKGITALDQLILVGKTESAKYLVDYKICLSVRTKKGETILDLAIQENDKEILTSFAEGEFLKYNKFIYIGTELEQFIKNIDGFPSKLLQQIINLRIADIEGQPTLFQAVVNKGIEDTKLEYLLNLGARNALAVDKINSPLSNIFNSLIEMPGRIAKFTTNVEVLKEAKDCVEYINFPEREYENVCFWRGEKLFIGLRKGYCIKNNILYIVEKRFIDIEGYTHKSYDPEYNADFAENISLSNGKQIKYKPNSEIYFGKSKLYLISTNLQLGVEKDFADKVANKLKLVCQLIANTTADTIHETTLLTDTLFKIIEYTQYFVGEIKLLKWYLEQDVVKTILPKGSVDNLPTLHIPSLAAKNIKVLELIYHMLTPKACGDIIYEAIRCYDAELLEFMLKKGMDIASWPEREVHIENLYHQQEEGKVPRKVNILSYAIKEENFKAVELLLRYKAFTPNLELFKLVIEEDSDIRLLQLLLDNSTDATMLEQAKILFIEELALSIEKVKTYFPKAIAATLEKKQQIITSPIAKTYPEKIEMVVAMLVEKRTGIETKSKSLQKILKDAISDMHGKDAKTVIQSFINTVKELLYSSLNKDKAQTILEEKLDKLLYIILKKPEKFEQVWAYIFEGEMFEDEHPGEEAITIGETSKYIPFEVFDLNFGRYGVCLSIEGPPDEELTEIPGDIIFNDLV